MHLLSAVFAAIILTSPAFAGEIVWRSPSAGVLKFDEPPPPELAVDPAPVTDFGVSYESTRVRSGTNLSISPVWAAGRLQRGYTFESPDLPVPLVLDSSSGLVRGRISVAGRHDFSVRVTDGVARSQMIPVAITVE